MQETIFVQFFILLHDNISKSILFPAMHSYFHISFRLFYIDSYRPYDKAGSYGIQEWIGYAAIERIDGSFFNVMGLPIQRVYTELEKFIDQH